MNTKMEKLKFNEISEIEGGCDAKSAVMLGVTVVGAGFSVAFPPAGWAIPIVGTLVGVSVGAAIADCAGIGRSQGKSFNNSYRPTTNRTLTNY